ncbi:hypothetical protein MTR_1g026620 [Medicago truncatula]|uniref:Uncharacterized protein n=1 Tax=Medicago truncatula TaxID=3880 RepID=A0A072VEP5_MEDTR|nr:hypothetical protein MTR_1g026620 [Medicago truncatula]
MWIICGMHRFTHALHSTPSSHVNMLDISSTLGELLIERQVINLGLFLKLRKVQEQHNIKEIRRTIHM